MSFFALIRRLAGEIAALVRDEFALAGAEIGGKIRLLAIAIGLFGAALVLLVVVAFTATATAILALALVVPAWLAALIVTAVVLLLAVVLALVGRTLARRATPLVPEQALASVQENLQWAKRLTRSK